MDLLADLLDHEGPHAREVLRELLAPDGPVVREANFNTFEVRVDHDQHVLSVWDVLDGNREPLVMGLDEAHRRLD